MISNEFMKKTNAINVSSISIFCSLIVAHQINLYI